MKVMTVVGTRPEIIRLSRVIAELDRQTDHILVNTQQNWNRELNSDLFADLEIRRPDHLLGDDTGGNPAVAIGRIIAFVDGVLESEKPDAFLVLGDTNSCLSAYAAKRRKIPVFHMEAGNRCFDQRVPEEINRRIVDHIADINLPYSDISREYLLREGFPPDQIIKTGSPMREVINHYLSKAMALPVLERVNAHPGAYYLVSAHREENIESPRNFLGLVEILKNLAARCAVVFSCHPRTRKRMEVDGIELPKGVILCPPFNFTDYLKLELNAIATLSDSGTISEESSILNFPAVNIREAHERPEAMEEATAILAGLRWKRVEEALALAGMQGRGGDRTLRMVDDYRPVNVSTKVVRIITSYVDYVNQKVWRK